MTRLRLVLAGLAGLAAGPSLVAAHPSSSVHVHAGTAAGLIALLALLAIVPRRRRSRRT